MAIYYEVLGTDGKDWYKLGYTSSKKAFLKEAKKGGWKEHQLKFIPMKTVKKKNPKSVLKWGTYAGGTGAYPGKHSYQAKGNFGEYDIQPYMTKTGGHAGYRLYFVDSKGLLGKGLWNDLGTFRSPQLAKSTAQRHLNALMGYGKNPAKTVADESAAKELLLWIENSGELYRRQFVPIVKNLIRKIKKGTFDYDKSVKLWGYLADNGAKEYNKEAGEGKYTIPSYFNKATRMLVAEKLAKKFVKDYEAGEYDYPEFR
jgi:hypothetical protein